MKGGYIMKDYDRIFGIFIDGKIIMDIDPDEYRNGYKFSINRRYPITHPVRFMYPDDYAENPDFTKVYALVEAYVDEKYGRG